MTPTLNAEHFLAACLQSVWADPAVAVEQLVIDGGSTDGTAAVVARHGRARWVSRPGLNQSQAINDGFRQAQGAIVAWLNADDLYAPNALRYVIERFHEDAALDALYGQCDVIDPDGRLLWREEPGAYDFRRLLARGNYIAQPSVFFRKRVLQDVGYIDEQLDYGMDFDLWLRLRHVRVEYVPRVLAAFRWHPASKSARGQRAAWAENIRIVRRYGGGWTVPLAWAYARCLLTMAKNRVVAVRAR